MEQFQLADYIVDIRELAKQHSIAPDAAVGKFILNLNTLSDRYPLKNSNLNFRALGQQWGRLKSDEKLRQQQEVLAKLSRKSTMEREAMLK